MSGSKEAFTYLWYDALNKMYYLGKHKGSPDDSYTHSSTIWESFTKDNIPEGVTRRILAYGTDEEMCVLEHKLLINRKNRCWNRYYNESLGDPRYVDVSGENNPMYGKKRSKEWLEKHLLGKAHPMYGKTGEANPFYGRKHTEETKRKISESKKSKNLHGKNNPFYGRKHSDEAKRKQRDAALKREAKKKAERQGVGTLEKFFK